MLQLKKRLEQLYATIDNGRTVLPPSVPFETSGGLGDVITDVPRIPPRGRIERYWGEITPHPKRLLGGDATGRQEWLFNPYAASKHFNLRSIEWGNWLNQQERADYLYAAMQSLHDLARVLGVDDGDMGLGGQLSLAIGARGKGGRGAALATFEGGYYVINVTKEKGKGALAHEWGHAFDFTLQRAHRPNAASYLSGASKDINEKINVEMMNGDDPAASMQRIFDKLYWTKTNEDATDFLKGLRKEKKTYWRERAEVFARSFERWVRHRLDVEQITDNYLAQKADSPMYRHHFYPTVDMIRTVNKDFNELVSKGFELIRKTWPHPIAVAVAAVAGKPKTKKDGMMIGEPTQIAMQGESMKAHYALVELDSLIPSHDPLSFRADPRYPTGCQQRDYTNDKAEQQKVRQNAQRFEPRFVLTDTPTATDGPAITTPAGYVLGGNSRVMSMKLLGDFKPYREYLKKSAGLFGFTVADVEAFRRPVVVRLVEIEMTQCALYSNKLNKGLTQGMDFLTNTISLGRQLSDRDVQRIGETFEGAGVETPSQAIEKVGVARTLIDIFRKAQIITAQNTSEWLSADGSFSDHGALMVKHTLLGIVLPDKKMIEFARSYTNHILKALPILVQIKSLPEQWNILPKVMDAIKAESQRRSTSLTKADFLKQINPEGAGFGAITMEIWKALDKDRSGTAFKKLMSHYAQVAKRESEYGSAMFGNDRQRTPEQIIKEFDEGLSDPMVWQPSAISLQDSPRNTAPPLALSPRLKSFLGTLKDGFRMLVWGLPGAGKSHLAMLMADSLSRNGKVLYIQGEDKLSSGRLKGRAERLRVSPRAMDVSDPEIISIYNFSDVRTLLQSGKYRFVIVDSMNVVYTAPGKKAKIQDWIMLQNEFPKVSFVLLSHSDKHGQVYQGAADLANLCTVVINVDEHVAKITKNWDGPNNTMKVF